MDLDLRELHRLQLERDAEREYGQLEWDGEWLALQLLGVTPETPRPWLEAGRALLTGAAVVLGLMLVIALCESVIGS